MRNIAVSTLYQKKLHIVKTCMEINVTQMQQNNNISIFRDVKSKSEKFDANYAEKFLQLMFFQNENGTRFIVKNIEMHINEKDF
jgi:hypothetical protein